MKLTVIGLGLIGGSLALDLRSNGFAQTIIGVDQNNAHADQALSLGLVDRIESLDTACSQADLVVLATPVNAISNLLPMVLDRVSTTAAVTDVGSTKYQICQQIAHHPRRKQYVSSHPMAGTERSGPQAAFKGLFKGKAAVICDKDNSDVQCLQLIEAMYQALQMRLIFMNAYQHDLHAAYVSHLSHISSYILANTVLDKEKNEEAIFNLASAGFESTVRLAKSSPEMWTPIFEQNEDFVVEALGEYIDRLKQFRESIMAKNFSQTQKYLEHANDIRRVLEQINNGGQHV